MSLLCTCNDMSVPMSLEEETLHEVLEQTSDTQAVDEVLEEFDDPFIQRSIFRRQLLASGLNQMQKDLLDKYLSSVLASQRKKTLNINIISSEDKSILTIVPPHYKFIDNFSNQPTVRNQTVWFTRSDITPTYEYPQDPFTNQPSIWNTFTTEINNPGSPHHYNIHPVAVIPRGLGDSARIGREVSLKRFQARLYPIRGGRDMGAENSEVTLGQGNNTFTPPVYRFVLFLDKSGGGIPIDSLQSQLFKMNLNTYGDVSKTQGSAIFGGEDYFNNNKNYVYAPINHEACDRFVILIDKCFLFPTVKDPFRWLGGSPNGKYPFSNILKEQEKFACADFRPIEFDVDLEGLHSVYKSDVVAGSTDFDWMHAQHTHVTSDSITSGNLCFGIFTNNYGSMNADNPQSQWLFRGYTRVFYEDK